MMASQFVQWLTENKETMSLFSDQFDLFELNEEVFLTYAMNSYKNPQCSGLDEFEDDLKKFSYLKRLFKKYTDKNELRERLILNHIIVIFNVFEVKAATKMLFFKMPPEAHPALKTFLLFLNMLPEEKTIGIEHRKIPLDINIIRKLEEI